MSALEYMLIDQHSSKAFTSSLSGPRPRSGYDKNIQLVNFNQTSSKVVEDGLRRKAKQVQTRAHSASQTDPVDDDDFDWNLSDKNDSETQVGDW